MNSKVAKKLREEANKLCARLRLKHSSNSVYKDFKRLWSKLSSEKRGKFIKALKTRNHRFQHIGTVTVKNNMVLLESLNENRVPRSRLRHVERDRRRKQRDKKRRTQR